MDDIRAAALLLVAHAGKAFIVDAIPPPAGPGANQVQHHVVGYLYVLYSGMISRVSPECLHPTNIRVGLRW
jgi:hypothetical protein